MTEPRTCYQLPREHWNQVSESEVLIAFIRVQAEAESKNLANVTFSFLPVWDALAFWKTIC